jgi:single-stranded-DNA-specific exonuclease
MSARRKRWVAKSAAPADFDRQVGVSPLIATILYNRGHQTLDAAQAFLAADYRSGLHDPFLLKGMVEASARVAAAIKSGEPIAIYGDFDTDGVTAVTLLVQVLRAMGGVVQPYIPNRFREGYGLNDQAISDLAAQGVRLLITVDCGISNTAEVAAARNLGIDVIITDHHQPAAALPPAYAVINPRQEGCPYPFKHLVGVGIAFKLVQALVKHGLRAGDLRGRDMLDVVALGTVADMGPLVGENRVLVKTGLTAIQTTERPGLKALIRAAGLEPARIDSTAIAFMLAPRLNAAGRLDDAVRSYDLLLADDAVQADALAGALNETNRARQELTRTIYAAARAQAEAEGKLDRRVLVLADAAYPSGVVGLVASRLVDELARPVLLIERGATESRGSARSIPGLNIVAALQECADLFVRFGGHSAAAGFTIASERLPELEQRLQAIVAEALQDADLTPELLIDADVPLSRLNWDLYGDLEQLEPFGQGNLQPVLMSAGVEVVDVRTRGADRQHLRLVVRCNGSALHEAIGFRLGHLAPHLQRQRRIDLAYTLEVNEWNGERKLQLNIKDFRRAAQ